MSEMSTEMSPNMITSFYSEVLKVYSSPADEVTNYAFHVTNGGIFYIFDTPRNVFRV